MTFLKKIFNFFRLRVYSDKENKNNFNIRIQDYQKNSKRQLRVMIITMGLSYIVAPITQRYNVVGIIECAPRKTKQPSFLYKIAKKFYIFFNKIKTLESFAKSKNIPYYYMNNGSDKLLENWVRNKNPDVIVVYSMSQLLKKNIFEIPKYGTINLHPSLLPSYRGPNPIFWMYYYTEKKGGVTVHYIDEGEDTGDIIYQEEFDIPLGMRLSDFMELAIGKIGVDLLLKALDNIENLPRKKQPKQSPTPRARNIKESEHRNIIDWQNWEIERIWHLLRGTESWLNPIEQPKGIYRGQRWTVEEFEKCNMEGYEISKIYKENGRYFLATKDGKIFLSIKFSFKNFLLSIIG